MSTSLRRHLLHFATDLSALVENPGDLHHAFDLLTRSRLLELADLERPLLRRLSCEAPGTFEHTLMICGLAEEGARALANHPLPSAHTVTVDRSRATVAPG